MSDSPSDFSRFCGLMFALVGAGYSLIAMGLYVACNIG